MTVTAINADGYKYAILASQTLQTAVLLIAWFTKAMNDSQ